MNKDLFDEVSVRKTNKKLIQRDKIGQKQLEGLREIEIFLSDFGFLTFGRDYVFCRNHSFSLQTITMAVELTAGSVISCCEAGCLADANTLLRKYRDDLFFYLYIAVYDTTREERKMRNMEANIERWIENDLSDFSISAVMKEIGSSPLISEAVKRYNLQQYFSGIGNRLNNYVHSNGVSYYNRVISMYQENELQQQMQSLLNDMRFITVTFMFLLTMCSPLSIMSTDYTDSLDCGMAPTEGSQYWVAPFVTEFFKNNLDLIDKNCLEYLRMNTSMQIE